MQGLEEIRLYTEDDWENVYSRTMRWEPLLDTINKLVCPLVGATNSPYDMAWFSRKIAVENRESAL